MRTTKTTVLLFAAVSAWVGADNLAADQIPLTDRIGFWGGAGLTQVDGSAGVETATSLAGRATASFSVVDLGVLVEHWREYGEYELWAAHLELTYIPFPTARLTPLLLFGAGQFWANGEAGGVSGPSKSIGVGLQGNVWRSLALRGEALARSEDDALNGEIRLLGGYSPQISSEAGLGSEFSAGIALMEGIRGPWEFNNPAYQVRMSTRLSERTFVGTGMTLIHWRIPNPEHPRGYAWDTRAVLATPELAWAPEMVPWMRVRGGPAMIMMGEGPDEGSTFGAHIGATGSLHRWNLPLEAGGSWLWLSRGDEGATYPEDQHALSLLLAFVL